MPNPFARPMEYSPSMNRQGITVWAHDVINELLRLGVLDPGNEAFLADLFGVYKNLEEFYKWVCSRPRIALHDAPRSLQFITRDSEIFALAHTLWDNLEFELALEKDGAFIEEMIDHLGWFWNIKSNLRQKLNRIQGLPLASKMDTLAGAASYALRFNDISRGNVIKPPSVRPVASVNLPKSKVAPGSKENPKNSRARSSKSRVDRENPSNNTMQSNGAPSLLNTQKTNTCHLKVPQNSPSIQGQPQVSMRRSPSSCNTQKLNPRSTIDQQSPNLPDRTPHNFVDLVDDDDDDYSSAEQSIYSVSISAILPTTQIQGDKNSNRAQGFVEGSMRPMLSMSGAEPAVDSGSEHANYSVPRNSSRDLEDSHSERKSSQPTDSPCGSGFEETVESSNANIIIVIDSSSPEPGNTGMEDSETQLHKSHPTSAVVSSENSEDRPLDRRPDEQESRDTGGTKFKRLNSTRINGGIIINKNVEGYKSKNYTSANRNRHDIEGESTNITGEAMMKGAISITSPHSDISENNMGDIKAKRPASADCNQENISNSPDKKKVKTSANCTAPSSEYSSAYMSLSNQNQPSTTAKSTTSAAVGEHGSGKHVSEKPVSENSSTASPE